MWHSIFPASSIIHAWSEACWSILKCFHPHKYPLPSEAVNFCCWSWGQVTIAKSQTYTFFDWEDRPLQTNLLVTQIDLHSPVFFSLILNSEPTNIFFCARTKRGFTLTNKAYFHVNTQFSPNNLTAVYTVCSTALHLALSDYNGQNNCYIIWL